MKKKIKAFLAFIMMASIVCGPLATNSIVANAGKSPVDVNSTSYENGFLTSEWEVTGDVSAASSGVNIVFPESATSESKIVNKNRFNVMGNTDKFLDIDAGLEISSISEGKRFGITFGAAYYISKLSNGKMSFVWFEKEGTEGLKVGVSTVDAGGQMTDLVVSNTAVAMVGESFNICLSITTDKKCTLKINNEAVLEGIEGLTYFDGYCGLMQTGGIMAQISNLSISGYTNSTPANVDFIERFNYHDFNANMIYTYAMTSKYNPNAGIIVEDQKLVWKDVADGYLSTKYKYSNVDISFDMHLDNQFYYDAKGIKQKKASAGISFIFGAEQYKENTVIPLKVTIAPNSNSILDTSFDTKVVMEGSLVGEAQTVIIPEDVNIFNDVTEEGVFANVWARMIDGKISVSLKYNNQPYFTKVFEADLGTTPLGYVQIVSEGSISNRFCNFKMDNLSVANFDVNRKSEIYTYRTSVWNMSDYIYNDTWDDADLIG